jgi:phosphotransferase system  glucose/maltose/N-acetylglucosamine-specific IIC component
MLYEFFGFTLLIAYSAKAVIVSDGFTPGLAGITEPSITYKPL